MGLFAAKKFKDGDNIAAITGKRVNAAREISGEYLYRLEENKYTDAKKATTAAGRYANESMAGDPGRNNAEIVYNVKHKRAGIKATETIKPGAEICVDYGNHFWGKKYKYIKMRKVAIPQEPSRAAALIAPVGVVPRRLPAAPAPARPRIVPVPVRRPRQ